MAKNFLHTRKLTKIKKDLSPPSIMQAIKIIKINKKYLYIFIALKPLCY